MEGGKSMPKKLLLLVLLLAFALPVQGQFFEKLNVKAAVLIDADSGRVLYNQNEHQRLEPASTTKVMTMLLIMEMVDSGRAKLNEPIKTSAYAESMGGSQIFLKEGEVLPLSKMIESIAVVSANDASTAVAEQLFGGMDEFIAAMNHKAKELGAKDTHFMNDTGLPAPDHYSSVFDMAIFARELITKHPRILHWTSIQTSSIRGGKFILRNTNKLLGAYPGVDGLKTGHTKEAGFCLVATAKRSGMRLISVIFGAPTDADRQQTTKKLLEYGFRNYIKKIVYRKGETAGKASIKNAAGRYPVQVGQGLSVLVKREEAGTLRKKVIFYQKTAPQPAGAVVGRAVAMIGGKEVGSSPVVLTKKAPKANIFIQIWWSLMKWIGSLFRHR